MRTGDLCSREVYLARPDDALSDAAREMRRRHVGALVVAQADGKRTRPIGIVTDRDIVCGQVARAADLFCLTVGDVMTPNPTTIGDDEPLTDAIQRFASARVRRAPVVNAAGDLVGILSLDDVLPAIAEELATLARLIGAQSLTEESVPL